MWTCPKCQREFKNTNQDHYCGDKPKNIDEYIAGFDEAQRARLEQVRQAIHAAIPEAQERISWSMPTFWKDHNILHFAGFKKHIGFYPGVLAVVQFAPQLDALKLKYSKGSIQIPYSEHLPLDLVAEIARWCWENGTRT